MSYNGHKNWNHWNVSLWLFNGEYSYNLMRQAVKEQRTLDLAARWLTMHYGGGLTPDGAPYTYTSIRAALAGWKD